MKKNKLYTGFLLFLLSLFFVSCNHVSNIGAKKGIIDISSYNIKEDGILNLDGDWEFYYGELLDPSDFSANINLPKPDYIKVPNSWTKKNNDKSFPEHGYATYRLTILTNDTLTPVLIENKRIFTAYKIWLNGKLLKEVGKIAKTSSDYKPELRLLVSEPLYLKKKNELIIQVANYVDRHAGILNSVRIGDYNSFYSYKIFELILLISVLSIIFIIGLYHFMLFLFIKKDYSYLVFLFLALVFITLGLVGTDTLLKNLLNLNFNTITRLFHIVISLYPAFIFLFFYLLFKNDVNKTFLILTVIFSSILLIFSIFFPVEIVREYIIIKILFILSVSLYFIIWSLPKAIFKKRQGVVWAFIGMLLLFLTNINDILFSLDVHKTQYLAVYGFAAYIIFQSLNIAERFSFSFKKNIKLTLELKDQNSEYFALNEDYKEQNEELILAKEKAETADMLKSAFLANMSHEIRTPMNAILGFSNLLNVEDIEKDKRKKITSYIINSGNSLLKLINDIIDISKIEAGQLEISKTNCTISDLFEELRIYYKENVLTDSEKQLELRFKKPEGVEFELFTDVIRLRQVLINLINNALKFTEKGFVEVSYKFNKEENTVIFSVSDSGIGLTKEQKQMIFNRFVKLENEGDKLYRGAGLGLSISKNIIQLLNGKIWVESEPGKGSIFYFTIPL